MPKPSPNFTWAQLERERQAVKIAPLPEDAFSAAMYAEKFEISLQAANVEIKKLISTGKIEKMPFRIKRNGHYVDCYRLKK